jgi:hypothetical protein
MAQSRHSSCARQCPLSGVKRTSRFKSVTSAFDSKRRFSTASHRPEICGMSPVCESQRIVILPPMAIIFAQASGGIELDLSRQSIASVGTAVALALLSFTVANADSASDNAPPHWDEVFAQVLGDQAAVSTALGYAKPPRSNAAAVPWVPPQQMPAVDGNNARIDGYGGGRKPLEWVLRYGRIAFNSARGAMGSAT